jgi:actin-related protein
MFETFNVPAMYVAIQAVLSLYAILNGTYLYYINSVSLLDFVNREKMTQRSTLS